MLKSIRSLLSLGIPLLILLCIAILGAFTFASIRQNAIQNGMSITKLTAESRQEMLLRFLKRQKFQAKSFIERSRHLCSLMDVDKRKCLQTALDGYIATIDAESARLSVPGLPIIISGEHDVTIEYNLSPDSVTEFRINSRGQYFFVINTRTDAGSHMLSLHVRLNIINEIFENPKQLGSFGETFLVAGNGLLISPPRQFRTMFRNENVTGDANIQKCQGGESFDAPDVFIDGKKFITSFRHVKELSKGCVVAMLLEEQALIPIQSLMGEWLTLIIIFAILSSLAGYLLTRKITKPIEYLSEVAISLQQGNFNIDGSKDGGLKEIRLFDETFKKMAHSMQTQIRNQEEVMAIVSHDLKNPLAAMKLIAQLGLRKLEKGPVENQQEEMQKALGRIENQTEQMSLLIDDLLDVVRAQTGKMEINLHKVSVSQFIPCIESLKALGEEKGINLHLEFPDSSYEVWADISRINQVFLNLTGNALKFTAAGGKIQVGHKEQADNVLFWVRDSGVGIPEEQISHIFKKHWQAPGEQKKGIGLGLFITKTIIDGHGGEIWVKSSSGTGSTFYFTLKKA